MGLLLLHASIVSMDGKQILINTRCSCNYIPWVHFTEFGKYNFRHLGTTVEIMSMLHFRCTEVQVSLVLGLSIVHLFVSMLRANVRHFFIYDFSFSVSCPLAGCTLGHCQKCMKLTAHNKARHQCTTHH
jgi:hypothetical protein